MTDAGCPRDLLLPYVLGRLPEGTLTRVAEHASRCPLCQAQLRVLDKVSDPLLAHLRQPRSADHAPPGPGLAGLLQNIPNPPSQPHRRRGVWIGAALVAAVLLLVPGLAWWAGSRAFRETPATPPADPDVQPGKPALSVPDEAWFAKVAAMRAALQAQAVGEKLAELNPGFDGKFVRGEHFFLDQLVPPETNHHVVRLRICTDKLTNLSPLVALKQLRTLAIQGSAPGKGRLTDLSPLKGMKSLRTLDCRSNSIQDFTPLKDVPLESLWCDQAERHLPVLQSIKTLKRLNGNPVPWKPAANP
jgi:hypothetical protein